MMDGVDHILWINLERATERREQMEKMLKGLTVPSFRCCSAAAIPKEAREIFTKPFPEENILRISAIDGGVENIFEYIDFDGNTPNCCTVAKRRNIKTTFVELACLISHLLAIHEFCRCGDYGQTALIFEDDMTLDFKPYWDRSVREICAAATAHDPEWDIIQLACISGRVPEQNAANFELIAQNNNNGLYSTGAYIIKYESAVKFINRIYDEKKRTYVLDRFGCVVSDSLRSVDNIIETNPVYYLADHYLYTFNRTYNYKYPYFTAAYNEVSTIHRDHECFHNESRVRYENFLRKNLATRGEPMFRGFLVAATSIGTFMGVAAAFGFFSGGRPRAAAASRAK